MTILHHSKEEVARRVRSLSSIAAGMVMARMIKPIILNVHATPTRSRKACMDKLRTHPVTNTSTSKDKTICKPTTVLEVLRW